MSAILQLIKKECHAHIQQILSLFPGRSGIILRSLYWRKVFGRRGRTLWIDPFITVKQPENIVLGNRTALGAHLFLCPDSTYASISIDDDFSTNRNVSIDASNSGKITTGNNVLIGPNTAIRASNHAFSRVDVPIYRQGHNPGTITIGDDVWISSNVVILPNVHIGKGSIVAAGVVTKDIPEYSVAAGVPARSIKLRIAQNPYSKDVKHANE